MTTDQLPTNRFTNRELSWLAFDERVLEEAADQSTPLLERVKFTAIAASNLDEFFMVRVAGLQEAVAENNAAPDASGLAPARQLEAITVRAHALSANLYQLTRTELLPALAENGIRLLAWDAVDTGRRVGLTAFFTNDLLPVLTPFAIISLGEGIGHCQRAYNQLFQRHPIAFGFVGHRFSNPSR